MVVPFLAGLKIGKLINWSFRQFSTLPETEQPLKAQVTVEQYLSLHSKGIELKFCHENK
jgi:hypothetical protein